LGAVTRVNNDTLSVVIFADGNVGEATFTVERNNPNFDEYLDDIGGQIADGQCLPIPISLGSVRRVSSSRFEVVRYGIGISHPQAFFVDNGSEIYDRIVRVFGEIEVGRRRLIVDQNIDALALR
jgi:hypothetical protein